MGRIIHVDNSEFFRKGMKTLLSELACESEGFDRGEDALNAVKAGGVSGVIMGLELTDMSGEEFIKRLTVSVDTLPPIIVVTSDEEETRVKRLDVLGVGIVIRKTENWKDKIRNILKWRHL
jgi:two-component system cell cycle response regulator